MHEISLLDFGQVFTNNNKESSAKKIDQTHNDVAIINDYIVRVGSLNWSAAA
jgi:hypothetical protein